MSDLRDEYREQVAEELPDALRAADDLLDDSPPEDVFLAVADALLGGVFAGIVAKAEERARLLGRYEMGVGHKPNPRDPNYAAGAAALRTRVEAVLPSEYAESMGVLVKPSIVRAALATEPQEDAETGQKRAVGGLGGDPVGEPRAAEGGEAL